VHGRVLASAARGDGVAKDLPARLQHSVGDLGGAAGALLRFVFDATQRVGQNGRVDLGNGPGPKVGEEMPLEPPQPRRRVVARPLAFLVLVPLTCDQLKLDRLCLFLSGRDEHALKLYEQLFASAMGIIVTPTTRPVPWFEFLDKSAIQPVGFKQEEALIPYSNRSFSGYRLLHEYFAFPERFRFVELTGLRKALSRHAGDEIELAIPLARGDAD